MGKLRDLLEGASRHISGIPEAPTPQPAEQRGWVTSGGSRFWWGGSDTYPFDGDTIETNPLRSVAHAAARDVLCSAVASMPVDQFRKVGRDRQEVTLSQVVESPSAVIDQQAWVYEWVDSWMECGNFYADVIQTSSMGLPTQVEIIPPMAARWAYEEGSEVLYIGGTEREIWPHGNLVHVPYKPAAGSRIGRSPAQLAAQSVSTAIAAEKYGADFFRAGGVPVADIKISDPNATDEQVAAIKTKARAATRNREPFAHTASVEMTFPKDGADASKFIELLQFECVQASRIYHVPPAMIYATVSGQNITYENASQADLAFLKWSLRYPLGRMERAWSSWLPKAEFVKFNRDAILEMTATERVEIHDKRLKQKSRTINEVRRLEDEEPFKDAQYDKPGIPDESEERDLSLVEAVQKVYLGVGTVLTADEAREMLNEMGADLKVPGPPLAPGGAA